MPNPEMTRIILVEPATFETGTSLIIQTDIADEMIADGCAILESEFVARCHALLAEPVMLDS